LPRRSQRNDMELLPEGCLPPINHVRTPGTQPYWSSINMGYFITPVARKLGVGNIHLAFIPPALFD
jgi:hypothetical protein